MYDMTPFKMLRIRLNWKKLIKRKRKSNVILSKDCLLMLYTWKVQNVFFCITVLNYKLKKKPIAYMWVIV